MGHIDHGKTTLLDTIRKTKVAEKEAGQITQRLGAYEAEIQTKENSIKKITFLDTPGHEAFSKLRRRGVKVADIGLLIVAADEGIKPQTLEALEIIQKENLPYLIVLNKTDKQESQPDKVKKEFAQNQVFIEGWGGKIPLVEISAKTGKGIEELLEMILLIAELEELKADPKKPAEGVIIEREIDSKRGVTATLLIQDGVLRLDQFVVTSTSYAPVRIFENFLGRPIKSASFSAPVRIVGFKGLPEVGSWFKTFSDKKEAEGFLEKQKQTNVLKDEKIKIAKGAEIITIPLIIKTDNAGSLEALEQEIQKLKSSRFDLKIIRREIGNILKNDFNLALTNPRTIIIGFGADIEKSAGGEQTPALKIKIGTFKIIYEALDWLKTEIQRQLPKETIQKTVGRAKILKIFGKKENQQVVGGQISEGLIREGIKFKIKRRENILGEGKTTGLEQSKMKTKEISAPSQFGLLAESKIEIAPQDTLEFFEEEIQKTEL